MLGCGYWRCAALAVLGLGVAGAVNGPEVRLQLGHVTSDEARLLVVKTNSSASQWEDSSHYEQQNVTLDPSISSEQKALLFTDLHTGSEYRACGSARDPQQEPVGDGKCFSFTTFKERSMTTAVVSGVVAAAVVVAIAGLFHLLVKAVLRRKNSKTLIVTSKDERENGVTNGGAQLTP
ncbi:uncharacterized protein LOC122376393 [Amphibalanus amphitrite]|uniref:uncharacterized protein LOC122376393 n=1 Tax=Amphibalanus amphitrite TaxID=1232801 RepID=UPI001C91A198|nr:uncharacterized protein LOC122376393 [Amphibalanus amphitrite]